MGATADADALTDLNQRFGSPALRFIAGDGGLPMVKVSNDHAFALISLHGAQVLSYRPVRCKDVLWRSKRSWYEADKPIRGGIPICFPWFGPHPQDAAKPAHGFARALPWRPTWSGANPQGATLLALELTDTDYTRLLWPHRFRLEAAITVGAALDLELRIHNTGDQSFSLSAALHTYLAISDIRRIGISGLAGRTCVDRMAKNARRDETRPTVVISEETDRIYVDAPGPCTVEDADWKRTISVAKRGSRSTVVWNPWIAKASRMPDFGPEEWPHMLCIEAANVLEDEVTVPPGGCHSLATVLSSTEAASGG